MTDTPWFTARKGARLAYFKPAGLLLGIIEVHPDHPPLMHWLGGRDEVLEVDQAGRAIVNLTSPDCPVTIEVSNAVPPSAPIDLAGVIFIEDTVTEKAQKPGA